MLFNGAMRSDPWSQQLRLLPRHTCMAGDTTVEIRDQIPIVPLILASARARIVILGSSCTGKLKEECWQVQLSEQLAVSWPPSSSRKLKPSLMLSGAWTDSQLKPELV